MSDKKKCRQDKLYQEEFEKASKEEEREKIRSLCSETSDWLDEEVYQDPLVCVSRKLLMSFLSTPQHLANWHGNCHGRWEYNISYYNM